MEAAPLIQVLYNGEILESVAMVGDVLRIGRMKQNELVLNHLSVSRFHAVLHREGNGFVLEDLGSENGTHINGVRITGSSAVHPGDEVRIGKHRLVLGGAPPGAPQLPERETRVVDEDLDPRRDVCAVAGPPEHTALFDFAMDEDLARSNSDMAMDLDLRGAESGPPAADGGSRAGASTPMDEAHAGLPMAVLAPQVHAGFILQRGGVLERVIAWDQERMCAGRARECEIRLDAARASRRHALFVSENGRHEVRDLDSVGGVFVNGERVLAHTLQVGDVVRIEEFELTFVLDQQPLAEAVQAPRGAASAADPLAVTQLGFRAETRPPVDPPQTHPGGLDASPGLMATDPLSEIDLLQAEIDAAEDADKDLTTAAPLRVQEAPSLAAAASGRESAWKASECSGRPALQDHPAASPATSLVLELRLPLDAAPEPVRRWLQEQLGGELRDLRIPVALKLRSDPASD